MGKRHTLQDGRIQFNDAESQDSPRERPGEKSRWPGEMEEVSGHSINATTIRPFFPLMKSNIEAENRTIDRLCFNKEHVVEKSEDLEGQSERVTSLSSRPRPLSHSRRAIRLSSFSFLTQNALVNGRGGI